MKVFITGALGFIGRALLQRYRADGFDVCGIDRAGDIALGVVAGDVNEPRSWSRLLEGADVVIHAAAIVSNVAPAELCWHVNVLGTRCVLEAATRAGCGRFVHISSVAAYGFDFPDGVDESYPLCPNGNPYVDTKIASEHVVLRAHAAGEISCSIVRPADVYGPGSRPWTIVPVQMMRAGQFLLPDGDRCLFSPVYIDNLVDGMRAIGEHPAAAGQIFNVGDGIGVTTSEFFGYYARMLGQGQPRSLPTAAARTLADAAGSVLRLLGRDTEIGGETMRMLARHGTYSIEKAGRLLGYRPAIDLSEGMRRTERWLIECGLIDKRISSPMRDDPD
jgi:nucleoside-diphosphate-sugar epimerase